MKSNISKSVSNWPRRYIKGIKEESPVFFKNLGMGVFWIIIFFFLISLPTMLALGLFLGWIIGSSYKATNSTK
jgi:hypothetical protein